MNIYEFSYSGGETDMVPKVEDCKCPQCGKSNLHQEHDTTLVTATETLFTGDEPFNGEPGIWWIEVHKCGCGQIYCYENGA